MQACFHTKLEVEGMVFLIEQAVNGMSVNSEAQRDLVCIKA